MVSLCTTREGKVAALLCELSRVVEQCLNGRLLTPWVHDTMETCKPAMATMSFRSSIYSCVLFGSSQTLAYFSTMRPEVLQPRRDGSGYTSDSGYPLGRVVSLVSRRRICG